MRNLIAVVTCWDARFQQRADVVRRTWAADVRGTDVKFFVGHPAKSDPPSDEPREVRADTVHVDAPDNYESLPAKTQKVFAWGVENGYERILKTDDDVYIAASRLEAIFRSTADYLGRVRPPSREAGAPELYGPSEREYASGFAYMLSRRAAGIVATAAGNGDWAEDRFVGQTLARSGIRPTHHFGFTLWPPLTGHLCDRTHGTCRECLAQYENAVVVCPYAMPNAIERIHVLYKTTGMIPAK